MKPFWFTLRWNFLQLGQKLKLSEHLFNPPTIHVDDALVICCHQLKKKILIHILDIRVINRKLDFLD